MVLIRIQERLGLGFHPGPLSLLIVPLSVFGLVMMLLGNTWSRWREVKADSYALTMTRNSEAFANAMPRLANQNLVGADPLAGADFVWIEGNGGIAHRTRTQAQDPSLPTATPDSSSPGNPGDGSKEKSDDDDSSSPPAGAHIELHTQNAPAGAWSVVQWQDTNSDWHPVEGWQGKLDNGYRRWWVHPKDFDTGPFRRGIFNTPNSSVITSSDPFTLPAYPNQTMRVEL